jgi:hypothetical protein
MQLSWRLILAPWIGGLAGWLAAHGLALSTDQVTALTLLAAGGAVNALHFLESRFGHPPGAGQVVTIVKPADPAKKPPTSAGPGPGAAAALLLALILPLGLGGCAALGLQPAQSTDESIAYGYGLYTSVEEALSAAVAAGQVTKSTAIAVDQKAGQARELLDAARAAETVNASGAATDLATATQLLTALQTWLNHPAGAPPQ